jgi:3-oxoacid CoA-transferase subunit A/glutaconate CoA-transferase subunit A
MDVITQGGGTLLGWSDPDAHREWIRDNKPRRLRDKVMPVADAVSRFVADGDVIVSGGFGHVRVAMAVVYEIIRQGKRDLGMAAKTAVHDIDILIGGGCVTRVECSYAFGHELRGLSACGRRAVQAGRVAVCAEISNAGLQWRLLAGGMGVPFVPARVMLGTETLEKSSSKVVADPWTGKPVCLVPSLNPDVSFIHAHRADRFGNCEIDGLLVEDVDIARASKRLIVTCEEIVDDDVFRREPSRTTIPHMLVDAVCAVPWGAHPTPMYGRYFSDEEHIAEWLTAAKTDDGVAAYMQRYVRDTADFDEYLELIGGVRKLNELQSIERMQLPLKGDLA